ncbi:MAG: RCC1 domain-containing protein [Blastocatellales bacterium]
MKTYNNRNRKISLLALLLGFAALSQLTFMTFRPAASAAPRPAVSMPLATGPVVTWGFDANSTLAPPPGLYGVTAISAGNAHSLALKSDGTVIGWGYNYVGQVNIPAGLSGVTAISAGGEHSLALKSDGTVVGWGSNSEGQVNIPAGFSGVIAISAGTYHSLALKSDGAVVGWGYNNRGQATPPAGLSDVTEIAAGGAHNLALKSDGTVVGWGDNAYGQATPPAGLSDVTAISAGFYHSLALKSDGTVVAWGDNYYGELNIPAGLNGVTAISAGTFHSLALKSDGTVVGWGYNNYGQAAPPAGLSEVTAIDAGGGHSLALQGSPYKFVMLAQEGVELDQRTSVVSGDVGARIASNGPYLGNGVEVSIGQQVEMLDPASHLLGDSIFIRQGATVYNPAYNDITNNGTVLGAVTTPLDLSTIPALPALPAITPGAQNIEVAQMDSLTLAAGSYGDLVVRQLATITFTGGVYHFRSWDVGQMVKLHFLAPAEIRIAGKLGVDQRSYLGPAPSAEGLTAKDIVIYVAGQNGQSGELGATPKAAVFGQLSTLKANVVVPNGTLLLRQRTEATGAFFGKWAQAGQQVKLTLESRF